MISFPIFKLRQKKTCFGPIRNLFSFSTAQNDNGQNWGNKLVKKSDEFVREYLVRDIKPPNNQP